jgi:hypothetical protein
MTWAKRLTTVIQASDNSFSDIEDGQGRNILNLSSLMYTLPSVDTKISPLLACTPVQLIVPLDPALSDTIGGGLTIARSDD